MRICFSVCASVMSMKEIFPANTINRVIVCNRDGLSYQHITKVENGKFDVDFDLVPLENGHMPISSTLKFHFYSGSTVPVVVAAGSIPMTTIQKLMAHETIPPVTYRCNFSPVTVSVKLLAPPKPMELHLINLEPSALKDTDMAQHLFSVASQGVSNILSSKLSLESSNGSDMFLNLITAHNMENQFTTHMHYQSDVEPTQEDSKRFYQSGLTMTALGEALHATCKTANEILDMDTSSKQFTHFVTCVCQSFMRSAHICPYVFDKVLDANLDSAGQLHEICSESFKLPLREPFFGHKNSANFLNADDCEGQATFMLYLFRSFQHLYETYADNVSAHATAFPKHLFDMNQDQKLKLWELAMKIGKMASVGSLRCDIILISAGSAALGDGGSQLGGHATCVLVNASNPNQPFDVLMEGTNSMIWDNDNRAITLTPNNSTILLDLPKVANILTQQISSLLGEVDKNDSRILIHLNQQTESKFYKRAFCQNGILLATTQFGGKLSYGIDMQCISDYDQKVLMPLSTTLIDDLSQTSNAHTFLQDHCKQRKMEIHPPPISGKRLMEATMPWSAMTFYEHPCELEDREYKTCVAMHSIRDPTARAELFQKSKKIMTMWNEKYKHIGYCSTYLAFDTLFTKLCFWTDDLHKLEVALSRALEGKITKQ